MRTSRLLAPAIIIIVLALIYTGGASVQSVLTLTMVYATIGLGWNIIGGYAGQTSFGHALFVGIGAYTVVLLQREWDVSPLVGVWAGITLAVLAALLIGWPTFRLSGVYFSLATLAYPLMAMPLLTWLGLQEVLVPYRNTGGGFYLQFADPRWLTLCALALLLVAVGISLRIQKSDFGESLIAIREDAVAAAAAGIHVQRRKLQAYCVSAAMTAAAGALYASVLYVVTPDSVFGLLVSVQALIIPIVGGRGTVWGPIIGSVLLITLAEQLNAELGSRLPGINGLMFGAALILLVLLAREGLLWRAIDIVARFRRRRETGGRPPAEAPSHRPDLTELAALTRGAANAERPILTVENLRKSFNGVKVLDGVDFEVRPGEILGVIGPNGAGKTTLLNIVNGFVDADGGHIRFTDQDVSATPPHERANLGIGRTFQTPRPLPRCSVERNVQISALHRPERSATVRGALRATGLWARAGAAVGDLDIGELRRLELARALAGRPAVLLVDEILAGLSSDQADDIVTLLRAIADQGVAVILIEHTMGAMLRLADRLVVLEAGTVITSGRPQAVVADSRVVAAYLGSKWSSHA